MKPNKKYLYIILLFLPLCTTAQNKIIGFPTPEASELGKYGQVPVSYFNGLPEISIPIYTIKCKDLEVPISLSYYAQGNKPDNHPGWVGLGWNLNAGGMITRVINGKRDELRKEDETDEMGGQLGGSIVENGYYYRAADMNGSDWPATILDKLFNSDDSYLFYDSEPDEFIFNFNNLSGSFYFVNINGQMQVKVKSKHGDILKVEPLFFDERIDLPIFENDPSYYANTYILEIFKTFKKFTITTVDGNKYEFGGSKDNIDFTSCSRQVAIASSWHLSKITSPSGDYVNFEYTEGGTVFIQNKVKYYNLTTKSMTKETPCISITNKDIDGLSLAIIMPKYLNKVTTSSDQVIKFIKSKSTELDYDNWANLPQDVVNSILPKVHSWNSNRLSKHYYLKLDRIEILGVKSVNLFYSNSIAQRLRLLGFSFTPIIESYPIPKNLNESTNKIKYQFFYNTTLLPKYNSYLTDNWGFYNNKNFDSITFKYYSNIFSFRQPNLNFSKAEMLEKITYPTGGATIFDYELNKFSKIITGLEINNPPFTLMDSLGEAGGLRIKKIINYSNANDITTKTNEKTFLYEHTNGSSSGILSGKPLYSLEGNQHVKYNYSGWSGFCRYHYWADYKVHYYYFSQNFILPLSDTNGNHVTYSRIKEFEADGSSTIYTYTNHEKYPDEEPLKILTNMDSKLIVDAFTSKELERGLLKSVEIKNKYQQRVKITNYNYNSNPDRYNNHVRTINKYVLIGGNCSDGVRYSANKIYTFYPYLDTKQEITFNDNDSLVTNSKYIYNQSQLLAKQIVNNSKGDSLITEYKYSCDFKNILESDISAYYTAIDLVQKNYIIEEKKLDDQFFIMNQNCQNNGSLSNDGRKACYEENRRIIQLPKEVLNSSYSREVAVIKNNILARQQKGSISSKMAGKNISNALIEQTLIKRKDLNCEIINSKFLQYDSINGMFLPIKEYDFLSYPIIHLCDLNTETLHPNYQLQTEYNYNTNGSIRQMKYKDGTYTSYLWSYKNQNPIAEIKNATYDEVKKVLNYNDTQMESLAASDNPDIAYIRNQFKNNFANKLVLYTTYTYKPLVGIASAMDSRGVETKYDYDTFNRLQNIKDLNGKILQKFDYNYKQQ